MLPVPLEHLFSSINEEGDYDWSSKKYTDYLPVIVELTFIDGLDDPPEVEDILNRFEWFETELSDSGIFALLDDGESTNWTDWKLRQGIAPGQSFKVVIHPPAYRQDYWGEWDILYGDWEITWREPLSDDIVWRAWLGSFASHQEFLPIIE